ncbi:hypothetical protein Csa_020985 [Cucumis sativus]|uniref:Uncharacterized protein n=1 Tax=Cucumis sativus TaxID=3659 RepID=A0A0A0KC71_CUCSA|nr:hypothetical protein Csa_020985 [Cucumis sativus]
MKPGEMATIDGLSNPNLISFLSVSQIGNGKDEDEMDITTVGDELRKGKARHQQLPPTARGGLSYVSDPTVEIILSSEYMGLTWYWIEPKTNYVPCDKRKPIVVIGGCKLWANKQTQSSNMTNRLIVKAHMDVGVEIRRTIPPRSKSVAGMAKLPDPPKRTLPISNCFPK